MDFTDLYFTGYVITQGVATRLSCGVVFSNHFITNFPQNVPMKKQ